MVPVLPAHLAARLQQPTETTSEVVPTEVAKPGRDKELFLGDREQVLTAKPPEMQRDEILGEEPGEAVPEFEKELVKVEAPVEIRANRDTWVVIKNENDQTLLRGLIRSGDSFVPERTARLRLTASDGGNLVLYVRGKPVSELGEPGYELRSLKIDVAGILKGTS